MTDRSGSPDAVTQLLRARRLALGWSYARLASAAKLASPAYVFHIENGQRVPSDRVAARLAQALDVDPAPIRAWAALRRGGELSASLEAAAVLGRTLATGEPARPRAARPAPPEPARSAGDLAEVPLLPEGADPDATTTTPLEVLRLDRRLLPPLADSARVFGIRLSAHGVRRVADTLHPGDCVVVLRGGDPPADDTPCAVRIGGRVELARVRLQGGALHLPRVVGAHDSGADVTLGDPARALIGPVVVAFRRWL